MAERGTPTRHGAVLLVVAGLAIGYLLGAYAASPQAPAPPVTTPAAVATTTVPAGSVAESPEDEVLLRDAVPGFDSTLLVVQGDFGTMEMQQWSPNVSPPLQLSFPSRANAFGVSLDAGRLLIGAIGTSAGGNPVLYVGPIRSLAPARFGPQSFAWHATEPGQVAWIEGSEGEGELFQGRVSEDFEFSRVGPVDAVGELAAWTAAGFVFQSYETAEGTVAVLDQSGEEIGRAPGRVANVAADGSVLLAHFGLTATRYYVAGHQVDEARLLDWAPANTAAAAWSPDGDLLALLVYGDAVNLEVWDNQGVRIRSFGMAPIVRGGLGIPHWSPDGRFVMLPVMFSAFSDWAVLFFDLEDGSVDELPFDAPVHLALAR